MYLKFFNLTEYPFSNASNEKYFFESDIHAEALANMVYTLEQRKGMVLVTGEVGAGKTFLGRMLARRASRLGQVGMIEHPMDSAKQLLRAVGESLSLKVYEEDDKLTLVSQLKRQLERRQRRHGLAAIILDEAQSMPDDALEEVRLMWNWEADGQRLLQIVLIGQPELRARLRKARWESLLQRIVLSYHLGRLGQADTVQYILHRRQVASYNGCPLRFTPRALAEIYEATCGIPRLINTLCDNALLAAYARSTSKITSGIIESVLKDMTAWALATPVRKAPDPDA